MMKKEIAEEIFNSTREYCSKLNESLRKVEEECDAADFEWYRAGVAYVMGYSHEHIMDPLFKQHPELEPEEWKGDDEDGAEFGRKIAAAMDARRRGER
ncbi:uncharacterized protein SOCEGT47_014000 [Sorangium cellulosum]|uniref:Uncharacterized protein n=1 Tax=Sorangium cellulosum TaxID=56 RepID=A0A4P2PW06_SORCE|nr:hypothetical protein [Sorangium cellulosum]AUX20924.1 uncharacterized protein SOCEGT47_014000 [Sorangium cellulosum]